jgi:hypothetical protein
MSSLGFRFSERAKYFIISTVPKFTLGPTTCIHIIAEAIGIHYIAIHKLEYIYKYSDKFG